MNILGVPYTNRMEEKITPTKLLHCERKYFTSHYQIVASGADNFMETVTFLLRRKSLHKPSWWPTTFPWNDW